ncbi:hypothetical protein [Lactobacillus sp. PV012]|uniref:hypothetical protein n=1 Tax=Lactobacillus sp. PV012 TaxID=2594494 RepID=UPI00223FA72A|nr:hypothetical protein [Lactobacillus sp. PV012]QNQ82292.1 hypothetical protein FP433_04210 [Lactobacillus sp. PV012]
MKHRLIFKILLATSMMSLFSSQPVQAATKAAKATVKTKKYQQAKSFYPRIIPGIIYYKLLLVALLPNLNKLV